MKFELERADNGWIVKVANVDQGEEALPFVIQEDRTESEAEAWALLFWSILEQYGPMGSRYDDERVYITVGPGDKNDKYEAWVKENW